MITKSWKSVLTLLLVVCLCLGTLLTGCRNQQKEDPETEPPVSEATEPTDENEDEDDEWEDFEDEYTDVEGGKLALHDKGKNGDLGIYFTMEPNDIPVDTSWKTEYRPASPDAIILYRDGEEINIGNTMTGMVIKYSETEYYLKLEKWNIGDNHPIRDGDVLLVDGDFRNSEQGIRFHLGPTYISVEEGLVFFSDEYPTGSNVSVKYVGALSSHPNGKNSNGIYFSLPANSLPYNGWSLEYSPTSESCVQLIRDGKTYYIGNKAAGTIVKYGETDYYLKLEQWIIKDVYPVRDGDIIVVSGKFVNSGASAVFSISKTYISIEEGLLSFSEEYPTDSAIEAVQIPTLLEHPNGFTGTGVYFKAEENSLPFEGWSIEYFPRDASAIKLIRDGQTYEIGNPDAGTIVKYNETDYYFKLEQWIYKNYYPFVDGDILVVEGKFVNSGLAALMEIGTTYIAFNGGMAYFFTEYPEGPIGPTKIQGTGMTSHPNGWNKDGNGGLSFILDANEAPFASDWSLRYTPTTTGTVKLVRDGQTYDVANTGAEMLVKFNETGYYLEFWPITYKPIVDGDMLIIEGGFANAANNVVINIEKTYITFANGEATFSTDGPDVIQAGYMQPHDNGFNTASNDGLYFKLAANELPYSGWDVEYEPMSANALQLIRGGETFNIGLPGRGTIVKYSDTDYYLKLSSWTIGDYVPIVPGDILIVQGKYQNVEIGKVFSVDRSVIAVGENYELTITEEEPVDHTIQAGVMSAHPNGWNTGNNKGMYFSLAENEIPFTDDWQTYYYPTIPGNVKLIRGGETKDIAQTDREFIVKYEPTGYYLKLETWTIGEYFPVVPGDVLIVEGKFTNPVLGVDFTIDTTYVAVGENYELTFTEDAPGEPEEPEEPQSHGPMKAHETNGWTATGGLYFTMEANDMPFDSWNVRYKPASEGNVKLIRNGQTYNVAHTARETIVKYSDTDYYFEFWTLADYKPVLAGDVLIVEGDFTHEASGAVLRIEKTTITFQTDGTAVFQSGEVTPEEPEVPETPETPKEGLVMKAWDEKAWNTNSNGGFWFTMEQNEIPADETWVLEYAPVQEDAIKLVRGGETVNIAIPGRGTIVKATDAEYYFKLEWNIGDYSNQITVGDVLIIEGDFTNSTNGYTFTVKKTTVTIGEDFALTFETEEEEDNDVIQVGMMMSNASGVTNAIIYFSLADNDLPYSLTKSDFRPASAGVIKLVRDGVTYEIGDPNARTIVKQTAAGKYRLLRNALTMELQAGDILVIDGIFTGGNTDDEKVYTVRIAKTYILIGEDSAIFSTELPSEE